MKVPKKQRISETKKKTNEKLSNEQGENKIQRMRERIFIMIWFLFVNRSIVKPAHHREIYTRAIPLNEQPKTEKKRNNYI